MRPGLHGDERIPLSLFISPLTGVTTGFVRFISTFFPLPATPGHQLGSVTQAAGSEFGAGQGTGLLGRQGGTCRDTHCHPAEASPPAEDAGPAGTEGSR